MSMSWRGVLPAITTPFDPADRVDLGFLAEHAKRLVDDGCTGIVALGSLGEGGCLSREEKRNVLRGLVDAVGARVPVIAGVAAMTTAEAVDIARDAERAGCRGLMVLPPYVYVGDWREMRAHVSAVISATGLSCMLYNNPIAYRTDFLPTQVAELAAAHANLHAIKESSADVRRITAIRAELGDRLDVLVGVDDLIMEGIDAGATGWIAGLVNAFPRESVRLFDAALRGDRETALALYRWFLPLLRMDTVPAFVHLIKLVQQHVGLGSERVRAPRLLLEGAERAAAEREIATALRTRPRV
jgi:4-hydroxy-tetrahydrodipicolinate synthase